MQDTAMQILLTYVMTAIILQNVREVVKIALNKFIILQNILMEKRIMIAKI